MKWLKIFTMAGLLMLMVVSIGSVAIANPPCCSTPTPGSTYETLIEQSPGATLWLQGSTNNVSKTSADSSWGEADNNATLPAADSEQCTCHKYWNASGSTTFNGGVVKAKYRNHHANVLGYDPTCNYLCMSGRLNGLSKTVWVGSNPYYSNEIEISEDWTFSGLDIQLTAPGGVGYSITNKTVSYTTGWRSAYYDGKWHYRMKYKFADIYARSYTALFGVDDTIQGCHYLIPSGQSSATICANGNGGTAFF